MNRIHTSIVMMGIAIALSRVLFACSTQTPQKSVASQTSAKTFNNQGVDKLEREDYKGAIENFNRVLQIDPKHTKAYFNRGLAYHYSGNKQAAIKDYTQAIQLAPQDAEAYYDRGLAYYSIEKDKLAIADFQKAAQLYLQQGNKDAYQKVVKEIKEIQE